MVAIIGYDLAIDFSCIFGYWSRGSNRFCVGSWPAVFGFCCNSVTMVFVCFFGFGVAHFTFVRRPTFIHRRKHSRENMKNIKREKNDITSINTVLKEGSQNTIFLFIFQNLAYLFVLVW